LSSTPVSVDVTMPGGGHAAVQLKDQGDGRQTGALLVHESGLYRLTDGDHIAFAASGPLNPLEFADLRSTPEKMQGLVNATGGGIFRLAGGHLPEIRKIRPAHAAAGGNWLGLLGSQDYVVTGIRQASLTPALLGLLLGLGTLLFAWRR